MKVTRFLSFVLLCLLFVSVLTPKRKRGHDDPNKPSKRQATLFSFGFQNNQYPPEAASEN